MNYQDIVYMENLIKWFCIAYAYAFFLHNSVRLDNFDLE